MKIKHFIINFSRRFANFFSYLILKKILLINLPKFEKSFLYNKCYQYLYLLLYLKINKKKKILEVGTGYSTLIINKYISSLKNKIPKDVGITHHVLEPNSNYFNKFREYLTNKNNLNLKIINYDINEKSMITMIGIDLSEKYDFIYLDAPSPEWNLIENLKHGDIYEMKDIFDFEKNCNFDLFIDGRYPQQEMFKKNLKKKYIYIKSNLGSFGLFKNKFRN